MNKEERQKRAIERAKILAKRQAKRDEETAARDKKRKRLRKGKRKRKAVIGNPERVHVLLEEASKWATSVLTNDMFNKKKRKRRTENA